MKIQHILGIILILGFFMSSCLEYQFSTRINPDGSCERTMIVRGDSSDLMNGIIPVPRDSVWKIKIVKEEGKKFTLTATAKFPKVDDLNKYFYKSTDSMPTVSIRAELKKKFRWFYTYLVFNETYLAYNPYKKVPIEKYLNADEEILVQSNKNDLIYIPDKDILKLKKDSLEKVLLTHEDSMKMEKKFSSIEHRYNKWLAETAFEETYAILAESAEKINQPGISKTMILKAKDSILHDMLLNDSSLLGDGILEIGTGIVDSTLVYARKYYDTKLLIYQRIADSIAYKRIEKKYDKLGNVSSNSYASSVFLPGIIIKTNASRMDGNMLSWTIDPGEFYFHDYVMLAEARILNRWTFWATGILVVLLTATLLTETLRKKRN